MNTLIFPHRSDIDGMGGAVLANLAFDDATYVLCETFNLQEMIKKYYENGNIYDYDKVYVTDLWLEEPTLSLVAKDERLKGKFFVFDHHAPALDENANKYDFATVRIKDEKGKCCGSSLFYEYLVNEGYLKKENKIDSFVELTRRYDTWEWKNIYNDEKARELTLLFDSVAQEGYIKLMTNKLKEAAKEFSFNELEEMLVQNKKRQVESKLSFYASKMITRDVLGYKAGIIFIDYEYRNDVADYLRKINADVDFVMMVAMDYGTISYRHVKTNVVVRKIAEHFGGKGHDYAASSPIDGESKDEIIKVLLRKNKV